MRKIIFGALKKSIDNYQLIWLLFFLNILISYISFGYTLIPLPIYTTAFTILSVYTLSIVFHALILGNSTGNWSWSEIVTGGLYNFIFMLAWFLFSFIFAAIFTYFFAPLFPLNEVNGRLSVLVFFLFSYLLAPVTASLFEGMNLKESFSALLNLLKENFLAWSSIGIFLTVLLILTGAASELLTSKAAAFFRGRINILSIFFIFSAEFIRSTSIVVYMATAVELKNRTLINGSGG